MNLREWSSNSDKFVHYLPEKERLNRQIIKVFGLIWNQIEDYLQIPSYKVSLDEHDITKRQVLSDVSKIYDPLGLISPVTFWGKVFLQKLWSTTKLNWDESVPQSLCEEWKGLTRMWHNLSSLQIPRFIGHIDKDSIYQLLVFCDASTKSYAATVYLRIVSNKSSRVI